MKKLNFLTQLFWAALIIVGTLNLESCSSKKATVSCPDLHGSAPHHYMAMHFKSHNANHQSASVTAKPADHSASTTPAAIAPVGIASLSTDIPKTPGGIYGQLTSDERIMVRQEVSSLLVKKPFSKLLNKMVSKKFDKLDKRYPAPAQSSFKADGGGGLSLGEILAIVAIACCVTFFLGIAGLVIGIIALQKINREGGASWAKILAILAIVFGALELLGLIFWIIFSVAALVVI
jgi:hypothetical protein